MLKTRIIILNIILSSALSATGQDMLRIDSLSARLKDNIHDSARCHIYFEIASELQVTDTVTALEYLESGRRIASLLDDKKYMGLYYAFLGEMHSYHGSYSAAIMDFDRALASFSESDDDRVYYNTLKEKGNLYLFMSDYTQAMNHYQTALDFYRRNNIFIGASRCLNNMGIIHKNRGEYVEALSVYEESVNYIDQEKYPMQIAQGYINMGNVFVYLGSYERALEYYEMALSLSEREKSLKEIALCLSNSGVIQNKCNNFQQAYTLYKSALEVSETINDRVQSSNCLINIGTNYADMGEPQMGIDYVEQGMAIKMDLGDERAISNCHIHLAEIYSMIGEYSGAIDLFRAAIPEKEKLEDQEGLARCYLGLGSVYLAIEQYSTADKMTDIALEIASRITALEHISTCYSVKREIAEARGDFKTAYHYALISHLYNDSLIDESTSKAVMEMEFRHQSKVLEKENENLRIQSNLASELMKKRNALFYSIIGIAILLSASLILVVYFLQKLKVSSLRLEEKNLVITKQNLKLDELNSSKDRMMSIIAHDLRSTIGNLLTAIDVLQKVEGRKGPGIDRKKLLGNLKHSASYSLELLENLLHWSRLGEKNSYYHPEEVNINTLIISSLSLFDETAIDKELVIEQDIKGTVYFTVDRIMMETIIRNLISNAIKFSNRGGIIRITAWTDENNLHLTVSDHGIGMTQAQIETISHNEGYSTRGTANEKGAGIGLTLVREFTSKHRGKLNITSEPGNGSQFTIILPRGN